MLRLCPQAELRFGALESLRTETLLALKLQVAEAQVSGTFLEALH